MTEPVTVPGRTALLVLNYNAMRYIGDCIDGLQCQTCTNHEIIVIDNASTDGSAEYVATRYPHVRLLRQSENLGVGAGFNAGIRLALAEGFAYIALFNPDIRLDPAWLAETMATFERQPQAQICASMSLEADGKHVDSAGGAILNLQSGIFGGYMGGVGVEDLPPDLRKLDFPVFFGLLTAMLVRREAFERCGLLAEDFFMYFEDIDFSWRVLLAGGEIWCNPNATLRHVGHGTTKTRAIELRILTKTEGNLLATYWRNMSIGTLVWVLPCLVVTRLAGAGLYVVVSPRIAWGKFRAVLLALAAALGGRHRRARAQAQALRMRRDVDVLRVNPLPLRAFAMPLRFCRGWLRGVGAAYRKAGSA